ncbi:hypothetical protein [Rufibacter sp. XAAS-G3-1]|uniref:hypothetical protein n=1 Tax=Rufibacter sp. XAAS-G3-1 TaxID=2729134 RepID=UPI0015E7373A|nr:hypothetical protein [Rufibacter sp. XAAS-G3-1]
MAVISEDSINEWIVPQLSSGRRGTKASVKLSEVGSAIIYRRSCLEFLGCFPKNSLKTAA